jgi:phage shock protein A
MKAILCLGVMAFLASCDSSKEQLANAQSSLADVTKQRDELKTKVASLQQDLDSTKADLAKAKAAQATPTGTMAAKPADNKNGAGDTNVKASSKGKHAHKS